MTDEFMGQLLGAQIGATHDVMNRLSDEGWREAAKWAERFQALHNAVYKVNDSIKVDRVLAHHQGPDQDTIDHYLRMAHDERAPKR